jgi:hypothetical protein
MRPNSTNLELVSKPLILGWISLQQFSFWNEVFLLGFRQIWRIRLKKCQNLWMFGLSFRNLFLSLKKMFLIIFKRE